MCPVSAALTESFLCLDNLRVHLQNPVIVNHRMPAAFSQFLHAFVENGDAFRDSVAKIAHKVVGQFNISVREKPSGNIPLQGSPDLLMGY